MAATTFSFSGHETFPLRFSWLTKAVELVHENPKILNADEAIAEFGVGRNMVRSIKHWGQATGVLEPDQNERGAMCVTPFGDLLFGHEGADPYCEDTGTLWVLHWHLCRTPERSTLWHFLFGHWRGGGIEFRSMMPTLEKWLEEQEGVMPSVSTLRRDLQCFTNTYVAPRGAHLHLEDVVSCPLATLGLVQDNRGTLYLREGQQLGLPPEIFGYAVLDYWNLIAPNIEQIAIQEVLERRASPGQILLLSEDQAYDLVQQIENLDDPPFRYDSTAGVQQLYRTSDASPEDLLMHYYQRTRTLLPEVTTF